MAEEQEDGRSETLERARRKKLDELQKRAQMDEQVKSALRTVLDTKAYERMMNVNISNHELYLNAAQNCVNVFSRINRKINEKEVLFILRRLKGEEEETKITFKWK